MGTWEQLDETLQVWVQERELSGTVLVTRHGRRVFQSCFGLAERNHGVPVLPHTRFGVASVSKMFTAVAVAAAVRRGQVGFDTPVMKVLPPERRPAALHPDVTVHHLLTHTSGIADYAEEDESLPTYVNYADLWNDRPSYRMLRPVDYLPIFGDRPPYWPPGERFSYCNSAFVVLALVVEELSGLAFPDAIDADVLRPAGMTSTGYFPLHDVIRDFATGYLPPERPGDPWRSNLFSIPSVGSGDGGAIAPAADLAAFLHAYDDGTLLGDLRDDMLREYADVGDGRWAGRGVFGYRDPRTRVYGHGGGDDGVSALIHRLPDLDAEVVCLCNVSGQARAVRDLTLATLL